MSEERRRYVSYLLRLWQAEHKGALVWRASLQSAYTGERWGFANMAELHAFLDQEAAAIDKGERHSPRCDNVGVKPKAHPGADGRGS
jgi:hypothetical protein